MIGRISGVLAIKKAPSIMIDCSGVGYDVEVSMTTFYQLPEVDEKVSVWTHLQIKDDQHALIGFATEQERRLFRTLIKINGVGVKMALTILSGMSEVEFCACILSDDIVTLTRLPGVGKKTAERLIVELRDKVEKLTLDHDQPMAQNSAVGRSSNSSVSEAIEALQALGYKPADAEKMIKKIATPDLGTEELIKLSLKTVVRR